VSTDLKVTLSGSDTGLSRALGQAERAATRAAAGMEQYRRSTEDTWSAIARIEQQMQREADLQVQAAEQAAQRRMDTYDKVGKAAMVMGAAIAAGLGLAAKAAMDWETAWTGVTKTVDGNAQEMAVLEGQLRDLAKTLPQSHEEIAAVAEAAGQLGIERESIAGFTKTVLDMGVSTNLTAEQAATDFARLAAIMQMPTSQMANLGSTAVALGNNFATTEAEIVALGLRLAGTGKQVGLTEADVFGLAAAMSQVGIEAEAGGSAMSQTMAMIQKAVEKGGDAVGGFAAVSGMTAEQFSAAWRDDAAGALTTFIAGLGQMQTSGGSALQTLEELGIKGLRQTDVLLRLSGAGTTLADALGTANTAFAENNALNAEASRFYETSANRLKVAQNQFNDIAIDIGAVLLPALVSAGEFIADVVTGLGKLPRPAKTAATVAAALAAAIGLVGGAAFVAIPKIVAFKAAVAAMESGAMKSAATRMMAMAPAAGALGVALAVATVGVGLFAARQGDATRKVDELSATLDEQTGALTANSREWMIKELVESGAMKTAKGLGLDLGLVTDAALGNADAMKAVNAELDRLSSKDGEGTFDGLTSSGMGSKTSIATLRGDLDDLANTSDKAIANGKLAAEANRAHGNAAAENAEKQKGLNGTWAEGAEEAGSLSEAADALKKSFDNLSGGFLNERDASRQVRDSLRDIREAMKKYSEEHGSLDGAFKKGTKSGDEFAGMLDGLAKDYQSKIAASVEAGKSEEEVNAVYEKSRRSLKKVALQMGMTKAEAAAYVQQILDTPEMVETKAEVKDKAATEALDGLEGRIKSLPDGEVKVDANTQPALDKAQALIRKISGMLGVVTVNGRTGRAGTNGQTYDANGSVKDYYADGGVRENHVAQIAPAGTWRVWAEPETGGEAYIPLSPAKRSRSLDIWAETGKRLGVAGFAAGGVVGRAAGMAAADPQWLKYLVVLANAAKSLADTEKKVTRAEAANDKAQDRLSAAKDTLRDARQDKPSRLDVLQQRSEVRDIRQSLNAKGKDRLTGLDREIAKAQLREAEAELKAMRASEKVIKSAKKDLARAKKEAEAQRKALAQAQKDLAVAERQAEVAAARRERSDDVAGQGDLFGGSVASASRSLDRLLKDVTDYNGVYTSLKSAGASGWLLGQLDNEARRGNYRSAIRFGRGLLADRALFAKIEGQGSRLAGLGYQQQVATEGVDPYRPSTVQSPGALQSVSAVVARAQTVVPPSVGGSTTVINNIQAVSPDAIASEVLRRLSYEGVIG